METGNISKPAAVAPVTPARADSLIAAGAVKTQLTPDASVQQAPEMQAVRFEPRHGASARAAVDMAVQDMIDRNLVIEPKTRQVIFQAVSQETGEVVRQLPDEAVLRLRSYLRDVESTQHDASGDGVLKVQKIV